MRLHKVGNRAAVLEGVVETARTRGVTLVKQGMPELPQFFEDVPGHSKDIDFWTPVRYRSRVRSILQLFGGYAIATCESDAWLSHDVYLIPCSDGLLQIDITIGDLMVGPLKLVRQQQMLESITESNRLSALPLIADLLLRPSARGNAVSDVRVLAVTSEWARMNERARAAARDSLICTLGRRSAETVVRALNGEGSWSALARRLRRQVLVQALVEPRRLRIAATKFWLSAAGVLSRRNKPFGRFHHGLLLAISGTDGAGKSSVIDGLQEQLGSQSIRTLTVYLGRSRGNLPGVDSIRNLVGARLKKRRATADLYRYSTLNKLVSWYYAIEYVVRLIRPYLHAKVLGKIVLCDRYVYDIQLMPGHSAVAARFATKVCPTPNINVLLSASPETIRGRKQERTIEVIQDQQMKLNAAIGDSCRVSTVVRIDTGTTTFSETCRKIVQHIHQMCHPDFS